MSKIFALSDLHLSLYRSKPMDIYGENWRDHHKKIESHWHEKVDAEDTVLLSGDISWAITEKEATPDLDFIENLPGKKILVKGNHDFWWGSASRLNTQYQTMRFLQNDFFVVDELNVAICGTRGWLFPNDGIGFTPHDEKIYRRELGRLERSLQAAEKATHGNAEKIVMLHYPPTNNRQEQTGFTELIAQHAVSAVVYGHLHFGNGAAFTPPIAGSVNGTDYFLTSADYLDFTPVEIRYILEKISFSDLDEYEKTAVIKGHAEFAQGNFVDFDDIDWN